MLLMVLCQFLCRNIEAAVGLHLSMLMMQFIEIIELYILAVDFAQYCMLFHRKWMILQELLGGICELVNSHLVYQLHVEAVWLFVNL